MSLNFNCTRVTSEHNYSGLPVVAYLANDVI